MGIGTLISCQIWAGYGSCCHGAESGISEVKTTFIPFPSLRFILVLGVLLVGIELSIYLGSTSHYIIS